MTSPRQRRFSSTRQEQSSPAPRRHVDFRRRVSPRPPPVAADIRGIKIALEMMQYPYAVLQRCWSWDAQELRRARDVKRRNVL